MLDNIQFEIGPPYGAFERSYFIKQQLTQEQTQLLIKWLATNLEQNFILLQNNHTTLAGGHADNFRAWKAGSFDHPDGYSTTTSFELRIHQHDNVIFEMIWHKNIVLIDNSWYFS